MLNRFSVRIAKFVKAKTGGFYPFQAECTGDDSSSDVNRRWFPIYIIGVIALKISIPYFDLLLHPCRLAPNRHLPTNYY